MRPLVFLDTETTGLDPARHEVWEIAYAVGKHDILSAIVPHQLAYYALQDVAPLP